MTEDNYKKVLSKYNDLKKEQEEIKEARNKLQDLWEEKTKQESNPMVQKYLQVVKEIRKINRVASLEIETDDYFFDRITNEFYGEMETNGIYVYIGTFAGADEIDIVHGANIIQIPKNSFRKSGWNRYKDIERHYANASMDIPRKGVKTFEEENIVLFDSEGLGTDEFYNIVKRTFFKYLIEFGQEEAVQKVIEEFGTTEQVMKRERRNNKID